MRHKKIFNHLNKIREQYRKPNADFYGIRVGDRVLVCGELETTVTDIDMEDPRLNHIMYWFEDERGVAYCELNTPRLQTVVKI